MAILLALLAALAYGASDFAAGIGGRRIGAGAMTFLVQLIALAVAILGALLYPGQDITEKALMGGLMAGVGSAAGTYFLYAGLSVGQMSVVAPLSAVVAATLPAVAGIAFGASLSPAAYAGLAIAIPAIGLVSWQSNPEQSGRQRSGAIEGALSGVGLALLFIGLDRAGTDSGAWPLVIALTLAATLVLPLGWRDLKRLGLPSATVSTVALAGVLAGMANVLFLAATGRGQLAIVAVLAALYPAATILLARLMLDERWNRTQCVGLLATAMAVVLITTG